MPSLSKVKEILLGLWEQYGPDVAHPAPAWVNLYVQLFGADLLPPLEIRNYVLEGKSYLWNYLTSKGVDRYKEALSKVTYEHVIEVWFTIFQRAYHAHGVDEAEFPWKDIPPSPILKEVELYPEPEDPAFHETLYWKREFHEKKSDFRGKTAEEMCRTDRPFELFPYQKFLRNYFNPNTPYQGLLLFHAPGSGKTCSVMTIAEQFRPLMASNFGSQKRALVLVPSHPIFENFVKQLHHPDKANQERELGLPPGALQCTGNLYTNPEDNFYEDFYDIKTYGLFRNQFSELRKNVQRYLPADDRELYQEKWHDEIRRYYSNRIIIVDEVHRLKQKIDGDAEDATKPYAALLEILRVAENVRLILLTATPVFNLVLDVIDIFNLLLANDRMPLLDAKEIFTKLGDGQWEWEFRPNGKDALAKVSRRYVSFVRGDNPITFPVLQEITHPQVQKEMSFLRSYVPSATRDFIRGKTIPEKQRLSQQLVLLHCPMSSFQYEKVEETVRTTAANTVAAIAFGNDNSVGSNSPSSALIVYPRGTSIAGFKQSFRTVREKGPNNEMQFEYVPEHRGFLRDIATYSSKYARMLSILLHGKGVHFASLQYNEAGVYTVAMLLEENGYENYFGTPYLLGVRQAADQKQCALCHRKAFEHTSAAKLDHVFTQAKYAVFDREVAGSTQNYHGRILSTVRRPDNILGGQLKVVLGSAVTNEGVDFANIRHVHILTPWWNLSRTTQIIGRAVRSCSHIHMPAKDRRVVVYRYCASPPIDLSVDRETADEWAWRVSLVKDRLIKAVERILKVNSIDCFLNKELNKAGPQEKSGERGCEYDRCEYRCHFEPTKKKPFNRDTEMRIIEEDQIRQAMYYIAQLFRRKDVYLLDEIESEVAKLDPQLEIKWVYAALDALVSHMMGKKAATHGITLHDQHGREGYLQYVRQHYVFLPSQFSILPQSPLHVRRTVRTPPIKAVQFTPPSDYRNTSVRATQTEEPWMRWDDAASPAWWKTYVERERPGMVHKRLEQCPAEVVHGLVEFCLREKWYPAVLVSFFRDEWIHLDPKSGAYVLGWDPKLGVTSLHGHLAANQPRCWDHGAKRWTICPPMLRQLHDHKERLLMDETLDVHVAYADENGTLKVIDRDVVKKKADRLEGKTCKSFRLQRVKEISAAFGFAEAATGGSSVQDQCDQLEWLLRERQILHDWAGTRIRCYYSARQWRILQERQASLKKSR